jgi:hypothetical protein
MNRIATTLLLATFVIAALAPVHAQPVRNGVDVVWARDVEGAALTLDGMLSEPEWQMAETVPLAWGGEHPLPGSSEIIEDLSVVPADPPDPTDAMLYILRNGNELWFGLMAADKSIGGGRGLNAGNWFFDGIIMTVTDRSGRPTDFPAREDANYFAGGVANAEFIYGWWHPADTLDGGLPVPGIMPRNFGNYGVGFPDSMNAANRRPGVLDAMTTVDGTSNDDTHGDDVGYTMEWRINVDSLGYDMTAPTGDKFSFGIAVQDADYRWPYQEDLFFVSRVAFQNPWANNYNFGIAYVYGDPSVTISSGPAPEVTKPEFTVSHVGTYPMPVIDGSLDDDVWQATGTSFYIQYEIDIETLDMNPGSVPPYHMKWFRPDINSDGSAATVVDPTLGKIKMLNADNRLFIGLDTDDQALSGVLGENGRDGLRITIRSLDSLDGRFAVPAGIQYEFMIDSTGALSYGGAAADWQDVDPEVVTADVMLKGASTAADPTDIDEGYQMEMSIDLTQALGYEDGLGDRKIWIALNFFDGDYLESPEDSYAMRTWILGERNTGASLYGYLSQTEVTANEATAELPGEITLHGNYPNPFNPSTTIRYALPNAGNVIVNVFDVLGRSTLSLDAGVQPAGEHTFTLNAESLSSGVYFYRVALENGSGDELGNSKLGRMILIK